MGGTVGVESEPGRTVFTVRLPVPAAGRLRRRRFTSGLRTSNPRLTSPPGGSVGKSTEGVDVKRQGTRDRARRRCSRSTVASVAAAQRFERHGRRRHDHRHAAGGPDRRTGGERRRRRRGRERPDLRRRRRRSAARRRRATTSSAAARARTSSRAAPTTTSCAAARVTTRCNGGDGDDVIWPGSGADSQFGGPGNDRLHALANDKSGRPPRLRAGRRRRDRERERAGDARSTASAWSSGVVTPRESAQDDQ